MAGNSLLGDSEPMGHGGNLANRLLTKALLFTILRSNSYMVASYHLLPEEGFSV